MSEENAELAARWYELWSETSKAELLASMPRVMAFCHPEVEWIHRDGGLTHRGREAVREALERWLESLDEYWYEVQRIVDCGGDEVLVIGVETGREAMSGVEVRSLSYELLTIRDVQIVCLYEFHDERRHRHGLDALRDAAFPDATWSTCPRPSPPPRSRSPAGAPSGIAASVRLITAALGRPRVTT